jgi:ribosome biogenesis protein UTP30
MVLTKIQLPIWQTDELWMDGNADVLPEGAEEKRLLPGAKGKKEEANVGRKRKVSGVQTTNGAEEDGELVEAGPKPKRVRNKKALPESNDDKLDQLVAERKSRLRQQKAEARKAVEA